MLINVNVLSVVFDSVHHSGCCLKVQQLILVLLYRVCGSGRYHRRPIFAPKKPCYIKYKIMAPPCVVYNRYNLGYRYLPPE